MAPAATKRQKLQLRIRQLLYTSEILRTKLAQRSKVIEHQHAQIRWLRKQRFESIESVVHGLTESIRDQVSDALVTAQGSFQRLDSHSLHVAVGRMHMNRGHGRLWRSQQALN